MDLKTLVRANPHPKDEPQGASFWPREGYWYVCGDRARGTVLFIMPHGVLEMTPEAAKAMADEVLVHATDVTGCGPSAVDGREKCECGCYKPAPGYPCGACGKVAVSATGDSNG